MLSAAHNHAGQLTAELVRGRLTVTVKCSDVTPQSLFGFAERHNPKRAFLFVSKVLGRHIPTRPSRMSESFEALAAKIPVDLPGPILLVGLAETAIGLGAGVHRALCKRRPDSLYLVSTRHPLGTELFARFEEEHSHASAHMIHVPLDTNLREMMLNSRSLVLLDDEASTGKTFINLYKSLVSAGMSNIERVVTATLTDWSSDAVRSEIGEHASSVALLEGSYDFQEQIDAPAPLMPHVDCVSIGEWPLDRRLDWGRLGTREHVDTLGMDLVFHPHERVLVIGTGEFVWRPFLLAERIERAGADVHFSSTTRSPIAVGHSIQHALSFSDNYGLGISNFLYNVAPGQFDRVLLCTETPLEAVDKQLINTLNAEVIVDAN